MERRSRRLLAPVPIVAALLALAVVVLLVGFLAHRRSISPVCWLGDAANYCKVATGGRAMEPFNRRPVVPEIVRVLPGSEQDGFRLVAFVSLAATIAIGSVLMLRLSDRLSLHDRFSRQALVVAFGAAVIVLPHGLRLAYSVPVFVDHAGLAVGLLWLALLTSSRRAAQWASLLAVLLAVATREIWVGPVIMVSLVALAADARRRWVAILSIVCAVGAYLAVRQIPHAPPVGFLGGAGDTGELDVMRYWWSYRIDRPVGTIWGTCFAVGLIPLVLISKRFVRWLRTTWREDLTAPALLLVGSVLVVTAPFLGFDLTRLAFPGGVILMIVAFPWVASQREWAVVPLAVGSIVLWAPTARLIASVEEMNAYYVAGYVPSSRITFGIIIALAAIGAAIGVRVATSRRTSVGATG